MSFNTGGRAIVLVLVVQAVFAQPYRIGPNVQVSTSYSTIRHYEAFAGADSKNAKHLIACAYAVEADGRIDNFFYVSFDRGKSWSRTLVVPSAVDPSCEIGRDGTAFAASILDDGLRVYRSRDGGRNWQQASITAESRNIDRAYLTVDDSKSAFSGRVYVHAYRQSKNPPALVLFYASTDNGQRFPKLIENQATEFPKPWYFPANGVVSDDGTFFGLLAELDDTRRNMSYKTDAASAPQATNATLRIFASRDGGQSLDSVGKIPGVYYDWRVAQLSMAGLAIDRSTGPHHGRLYAIWPDARLDHRTQIFLAHSDDQGRSWSEPMVVSDDDLGISPNPAANHFMPAIAVNRRGIVGITWYDRRDNPDNFGYWVRFRASMDGGANWLPSTRISPEVHKASEDTRKNSGDTAGLAADAGGDFHPAWVDNRTGIPQMWTATVHVIASR